MSIVVVGSIAFDSISTPFGFREKSLGGAANYFSMSAQFFSKVLLVGVVGEDFPEAHLQALSQRGVDLLGVTKAQGKSFHWQGEYGFDLNEARSLKTELNVFEHFKPSLPKAYCGADTIFLANIEPALQIHVLKQMQKPRISALDTMNFWIQNRRQDLQEAISMVDILFINDSEIRQLSGEHNIVKAAKMPQKLGAKTIIVKRGEFGSLMFHQGEISFVPAYPLEDVFDPTGAGDTFAGGFLGLLDRLNRSDAQALRQAMVMGTVMSSFVIEKFSFDRLLNLKKEEMAERTRLLHQMLRLDDPISFQPFR
jgi:sugar/nucleoside kinase (ribokinase family)